MKAEELNSNI